MEKYIYASKDYMIIGGERRSVQNPLIRYAEEAGWQTNPIYPLKRMDRGS